MHRQLLHVCRQVLASDSETSHIHRTVRRWMKRIETRNYQWIAWSMRLHGNSIRCSRLRKQVKALTKIVEKRIEENSDNGSSSSEDGSSTSSDDEYFRIDKIVGMRFGLNNEVFYLVRWSGFGPDDDTWEPREKLIEDGCRDRIAHFHARIGELPALR